jgi:diguanylate cyclase (GGDEF)-like protein
VLVALLALTVAGPASAPDGSGMQWDELVLSVVAAGAGWAIIRRTRAMDPAAARPWLAVGVGALFFTTSQLLQGCFPGRAFDGFGIDDVLLFAGASSPLVACALLARRVGRTRWGALVLDGASVTAALLVVTELLRAPVIDHPGTPGDLRWLVLIYGGYSAVMLGCAGALCTVSTRALRPPTTILLFAVAWQAVAAFAHGLAIVLSSELWNTVSDFSVALGLLTTVAAVLAAPPRREGGSARAGAPKVSAVGIGLVVVSLLGVPVGVVWSLLTGRQLSPIAECGIAVVLSLVAVRAMLRMREEGRMAEDLLRSEEDFRGPVESCSDGVRDVTTRRRRERELERMAYTDHLTGLPNRAHLFDDLDAAAAAGGHCLLVLDLDGFKAVNDVAGHETGDHLLIEVARRLNTVVRGDDLVARLGGDEFAVLVRGSVQEAGEVAQRIVVALASPYRVRDWTFPMGASVGVATIDAGGGQLAFRSADAALRAAKQAGKGCVRVAGDERGPAPAGEADLTAALAAGSLGLRFDGVVDATGRLVLVHAVPVWEQPPGALRGADLWSTAERQGCTPELLRWLLDGACAAVAGLDDALSVAVSLPPGSIRPDGVADVVTGALDASGLPPARLLLSLTEETLLTSPTALAGELAAVRRTGVRLCLDNYGMGHSLFALLDRVMLDVVRVDLTSLTARGQEPGLQVLSAIVRTSVEFEVAVIAGGVRTEELREAAIGVGAQLLHGRALPHGLSAADLADTLTQPTPA